MKKLIALLLVVVMAMSAVVTVAAEGTQQETSSTIKAPTYVGAQVKAGTGFSEGTYSVRFVSTVKSTAGKCIGYEITATYGSDGKDVYSGEETEGVTVYSSIVSGTETKTASQLEKGAVGIYVMSITGVPEDEHVIFNVTAYVKYDEGGEEKVLKSTAKYERYADGEVMPLVSTYTQDFDTATTPAEANFTSLYGDGTHFEIKDKKLAFNTRDNTWGDARWQIVPSGTFKYAPSVYAIEMNLTFSKLNIFNMFINSDKVAKNWNTDRQNSLMPIMRFGNGSSYETEADIVNSDKDIWIETQYCNSSNTYKTIDMDTTSNLNSVKAVDLPDSNREGTVSFKYTIIVDSSYVDSSNASGCKLDYYINDEYLASCVCTSDIYDITKDSSIILWNQKSEGTIDNLKVSVLAQETIYSQNFDTATTAADAGVTNLYGGLMQPTIVDGKLNIPSTAWNVEDDQKVKHLSPFATLVGRDVFAGKPGKYSVEFDVEFTKLTTFGIIVNGKTTAENDTSYMRQAAFATLLRLGKGVDQLSSGSIADKAKEYDLWYRTAYFTDADTPVQTTDTKNDKLVKEIAEGATSVSVKFKVVVDSTPADGCTFSIFADGNPIYEVTMANGYDVTENSYISLWAQDTVATIDNLTVTQLYK